MPRWLRLWLLVAVAFRIGYHATYLGEVPFALATFSDGRVYQTMAEDLMAHPPWGAEPFWLQGAYAAFMAACMAIGRTPAAAVIGQLVVMAIAWWGFWRALAIVTDKTTAGVALAIALSYPGLLFYENKHLTAALGCASLVAMLGALSAVLQRGTLVRIGLVGAATGLAVLMRGNLVIAIPFAAIAVVIATRVRDPQCPVARTIGAYAVGLVLVLTPMLVRNVVVTGQATVLPAHGGGTSFYIGNNRHARGVWNDAGGLLSGDVAYERAELADALVVRAGTEAERAQAIGAALYRRAFDEIRADPARWAWLLVRKAWLTIGNDELSQDYDRLGERELVGWGWQVGLPFGVLLAMFGAALVGAWGRPRDGTGRAWSWICGGQALAVLVANIVFFTSAQHRVALVIPLVAWTAWARPDRAWRAATPRRRIAMAVAAVVLVVASAWPRARAREPSTAHDLNLALAYRAIGEPDNAMAALDRAVRRAPGHAVIRIERATLAARTGDAAKAREDLAAVDRIDHAPQWIRARADQLRVALER